MRETDLIFVDESVQRAQGFTVTAFVAAGRQIEGKVADLLRLNGLAPGTDEFKSGFLMEGNAPMQSVREGLLTMAATETHLGALISPASPYTSLKSHLPWALDLLFKRNGLVGRKIDVFLDQGLPEWSRATRYHAGLKDATLHFGADSRLTFGIQVADAVAHSISQVLRNRVRLQPKMVAIPPYDGYAATDVNLGWLLLMRLRFAFFVRPLPYPHLGQNIDPDQDPLIINPEDDPVISGKHPELLGWGIFIADAVEHDVRVAAEKQFRDLWLGCTH